jgi:hypothetical protein
MAAKKSVTKKVAPAKKSAAVKKLVPAKKNSKSDAKLGQEIVKRIIDAINSLPEPEAKAAKTAKAKVTKTAPKAAPAPAAPAVSAPTSGSGVQITSSKACQAFAKRANQVKDIVSKARPGASITIDEQKKEGSNPDRGSFVITVGGKKVVELRSMPRPFTAMKALDMEKVANDVIKLL